MEHQSMHMPPIADPAVDAAVWSSLLTLGGHELSALSTAVLIILAFALMFVVSGARGYFAQ
jgi:hypothetical protein